MESITSLEPKAFTAYLSDTHNTICGRHPIAVLLNVSVQKTTQNAVVFVQNITIILSFFLADLGSGRSSISAGKLGVFSEVCSICSIKQVQINVRQFRQLRFSVFNNHLKMMPCFVNFICAMPRLGSYNKYRTIYLQTDIHVPCTVLYYDS